MINMPEIKVGLIVASRGRLPIALPRSRFARVVAECAKRELRFVASQVIIRDERDAIQAAEEMTTNGVDAAVIYLGNFGPEGPIAIFAERLGKPVMLCGAAEESAKSMGVSERGDALCGLLNASMNCTLRHVRPYIPEKPIGLPQDVAAMIERFVSAVRVVVGVKNLKIISFGPRPSDFYVCTAPIKPLYDLGVEVLEKSELEMYDLYKSVGGRHEEIAALAKDMAAQLGDANRFPDKLPRMAQFELALTTFLQENLGSQAYGLFASRCWPAFASNFGFVPCFVNSRLAARGIPAACEADIYGGLSEYMAQLASLQPATILDVNNNVPDDLPISDLRGAAREDLFIGYHCGNTPAGCLAEGHKMSFQPVMNRLLEGGKPPEITCGTLEGQLKPAPTTLFRLHSTPGCNLRSYIAEGHILDAALETFGGAGVFAIRGFARFYRHVLLEKGFPHHAAVAFQQVGRTLFDALQLFGVTDISVPRPSAALYPRENPFSVMVRQNRKMLS